MVSSTNKIDCHYITEIFLKVVLNTIKPTNIIDVYDNCHPSLLSNGLNPLTFLSLLEGNKKQGGGPYASKIGKNMIFWCKIVIFHTKYPKNLHAYLHSAQFF
jgi:hypothetical protein